MGADRFLAEIKTTANLQHPHILPLRPFDLVGAYDSDVSPDGERFLMVRRSASARLVVEVNAVEHAVGAR